VSRILPQQLVVGLVFGIPAGAIVGAICGHACRWAATVARRDATPGPTEDAP
jgi:hypothetical protein